MASAAVFFVLARILLPSDLGLVAYTSAISGVLMIILNIGLGAAVTQRSDLEQEHISTAFSASTTLGFGLSVLGVAASGPLSQLLGRPEIQSFIAVLSLLAIPNGLVAVPHGLLLREMRFRRIAGCMVSAQLAGGLAGIVSALYGLGAWSLVVHQLVSAILRSTSMVLLTSRQIQLGFSWPHFRELISFGFHTQSLSIFNYVTGNVDRFVIGYYLGDYSLGYYAVARKIVEVFQSLFIQMLGLVSFPAFSRYQMSPLVVSKLFSQGTSLVWFLAAPVFLTALSLSGQLVHCPESSCS